MENPQEKNQREKFQLRKIEEKKRKAEREILIGETHSRLISDIYYY